ncbi:hypothetical protein [Mangrovicoccus ximenensis]|uniref:hypothetical protein n=1 Tax=Mangrovicoccus ximenensis TaxID=1911570 RepID=UPI0022AA5CCB|nr:hypothetical protein [Mangrovicoccus ximenensis]
MPLLLVCCLRVSVFRDMADAYGYGARSLAPRLEDAGIVLTSYLSLSSAFLIMAATLGVARAARAATYAHFVLGIALCAAIDMALARYGMAEWSAQIAGGAPPWRLSLAFRGFGTGDGGQPSPSGAEAAPDVPGRQAAPEVGAVPAAAAPFPFRPGQPWRQTGLLHRGYPSERAPEKIAAAPARPASKSSKGQN